MRFETRVAYLVHLVILCLMKCWTVTREHCCHIIQYCMLSRNVSHSSVNMFYSELFNHSGTAVSYYLFPSWLIKNNLQSQGKVAQTDSHGCLLLYSISTGRYFSDLQLILCSFFLLFISNISKIIMICQVWIYLTVVFSLVYKITSWS